MDAMRSVLHQLTCHARRAWCPMEGVGDGDRSVTDIDRDALQTKRNNLLKCEGRIESLVSPGYFYPMGGPTSLDVVRLAEMHRFSFSTLYLGMWVKIITSTNETLRALGSRTWLDHLPSAR